MSGEPWTVVVVEDNPEDRLEIRRMLLAGSGRRYRFVEAETCGHAKLACAAAPDVVILDYNLPDGTAFDVLHDLREEHGFVPCPVVVLTGGTIQAGRDLVRAGAQDFFAKSWLDPERLTHTLENAVERFAIERDLREREQALRDREDLERYLIGIVSHDLRNPLSTVLLATQTALRWPLDERTAKVLSRIHKAADRASRMIRDLLDFTQDRLGAGIPVERKPEDLGALCAAVIEEERAAHPERELRLSLEDSPRGEWDADRIVQALHNLLSNAVHYSPAGTAVSVRVRSEEGVGVIAVHNWGEPIPPELLPAVFEPLRRFTRSQDSTSSVGLGLYIVSRIARAHGGGVTVESSAEAGTTFTLRLPVSAGG